MDKSLDGTALQELIRQISAMPGSTHEERCAQYVTLLKSQFNQVSRDIRREMEKLEFFVRGFGTLERNSLLAERLPGKVAKAA